ncbi:hypothetical protein OBBRIDRAFT_601294 [Obba rivulosa]|uniref:DUF6535 domain-containing protein n=1 Tax=Obba rivulosa TaxID=1052685 RepID=A0A8E2ASU7_9APHY|nr:hypothetical protein OBBRIDRAFT_601294 [Obba rivulosa]
MDRPLATERGLSDTPTLVASQGASSADKRTPLIGRKLSEPPTAGTGDYDDNAAKCGCKSGRTSRRCVCKLREDDARVAWKERAKAAADEGWAECSRRLHKRNKDMVGAWKEEIDTLLVFAGLFSAVLTAFNVGLFMSLNPDPGVDLTNHILLQISAQLSNLSIEGNSIRSSALFPPPNPKASASSIWINALWFSSLVCSLASATVGILVRQWLNYFLSKSSSQPRKSAYIHCLRYDRGLVAWRVPEILGTLPILLLIALVLFLVGLVILLWTLNNIVAGITTGLVAPLLIFLAVTTVAPAFNVDCPYKSPQALPIFWLFQDLRVSYGVRLAKAWIHRGRPRREQGVHTQSLRGRLWSRVSGRPRGPTVVENNRAMTADGNLADLELGQGRVARGWGKPWAAWKKTMDDFVERRGPKKTRPYGGWIEQEQAVVTDDNDILLSPELKEWLAVNVLSCADAYLVDDSFLDCVIAPCILDPEKKTSTALESLRAIMHGNRFRSLRTGQSLAALAVDLVDKILAGNKDSHDIEMFANSFSDYIAKHAAELWERAAANCARLLTCDPTYPDKLGEIGFTKLIQTECPTYGRYAP